MTKAAAAKAIEEMNNKRIGTREVRTNWATSKRAPPQSNCDPEAVARASSEHNTTVYVGGIQKGHNNDRLLRDTFNRFGPIEGTFTEIQSRTSISDSRTRRMSLIRVTDPKG